MAMRDLLDMYARSPRPHCKYYVSLCSHSNNTSSFNPTSNCHICLQGYKYKLLMPYSLGV